MAGGALLDISPLGLAVYASALVLLHFIVYGLLLCPVRRLPGRWHSRFTGLQYTVASYSGRAAKHVDGLHRQYGPIVRVAPCLVSVTGEDAVRTIYGGQRPWAKDARLARLFSMCRPQHLNVAAIQDSSDALKRRRLISAAFSTKFLTDNEGIFADVANASLLKSITDVRAAGKPSIDILHTYRKCATEVIVEIAFGGCFDSVAAGDPVHLLDDALHAQFIYSLSLPIFKLMRLVPQWFPFVNGCDQLATLARRSIETYRRNPGQISPRKDCLGPMLNAKEDGSDKALPLETIVSETMVFLFAGVDSTANTATYATWELARHSEIQNRARAEVRAAFPGGFSEVTSKKLTQMRYLNGCIAETLRMHAPLPGLPTRICPRGGRAFYGYMIPEGVSVGVQQWTVGRDPRRYPNPTLFDPLRWDMDEMTYNKELESMMAFSFGPRICIGKNIALLEIRHFLAILLLSYTAFRPAPETTEDSMDEFEAGLTVPKAGKCVLEFA